MFAGDTILIPGADDHLWTVISDPVANPPEMVVVLFVSLAEDCDDSCVLEPGEHPFIRHSTAVQYPGTKVVPDARLEELKKSGKLKMKTPLSPATLEKIRRCAEVSDIPLRPYEILREQGFVP